MEHEHCVNGRWINETCVCDEGWSGKTDLLNFDGYDCSTNILLERILWSIVVLLNFQLLIAVAYSYRSQYHVFLQFKTSRKQAQHSLRWIDHTPNRNITAVLISIGLILGFSVPKALNFEHRVIGTDWGPSIAFTLVQPLVHLNSASIEISTFDAITGTFGKHLEEISNVRGQIVRNYFVATMLMSICTAGVVLAGCTVQGYHPHEGLWWLIVPVRNCSMAVFTFWAYRMNKVVAVQIESLYKLFRAEGAMNTQSAEKVELFLANAQKIYRAKRLATVWGAGLYLIFALPFLWEFQYICITVASIPAYFMKAHPGRMFIRPMRRKSTAFGSNKVHALKTEAQTIVTKTKQTKVISSET